MVSLGKRRRSKSISIRLQNIDFLLDKFKELVYEIYGFEIGIKDVFAYCIRNAHNLERVSLSQFAIFESGTGSKNYAIRQEDVKKMRELKINSSIKGVSNEVLIIVLVLAGYSQLSANRQLTIQSPVNTKGKKKAASKPNEIRTVNTRSHLDLLLSL